jgi:hypothetical protein
MAVSKFVIACTAAIFAGGALGTLADENAAGSAPQVRADNRVTPIRAIADPERALNGVAVQFVSGKRFGRVVAISTNAAGHVSRIRVALDDMPAQKLWLDQQDLVYSRARDVIVAHDVHAPAMTVADAR